MLLNFYGLYWRRPPPPPSIIFNAVALAYICLQIKYISF